MEIDKILEITWTEYYPETPKELKCIEILNDLTDQIRELDLIIYDNAKNDEFIELYVKQRHILMNLLRDVKNTLCKHKTFTKKEE